MSTSSFTATLSADDLAALDQIARRQALTVFDRPMVLEAGAGTGKTATLVGRVVLWSLGPGWDRAVDDAAQHAVGHHSTGHVIAGRVLEGVVAITFTEAAAAEMAERVARAFADAAEGKTPLGLDGALDPRAVVVRQRAAALLGALDRLRISTIHAFCRRVLSAYPIEAGLHPRFEVDADGTLATEVVQEVVERWLMARFGAGADADDLATVEQQQALLALSAEELGPHGIAVATRRLAESGVPGWALREDPFEEQAVTDVLARLQAATEGLADLVDRAVQGADKAPNARAIQDGLHAVNRLLWETPRGRAGLRRVQRALEDALPPPLETHVRRFWARGRTANSAERACFRNLLHELRRRAFRFLAVARHVQALDPALMDAARAVIAPMLSSARAELRARGVVTFDDLLETARRLLADDPRVLARVRSGIRQLLVDEFQDTDQAQCDLVRMLALSGPEATRPGLFVVGDPKQSIYGWRNADLAAYEGFLDEVERAGGELRHLSVNYRSVPAILTEVDRVLEPVMLYEAGVQARFRRLIPGARRAADAWAPTGRRASVEHWVSWPADDPTSKKITAVEVARLEARALARDARRLADEEGVALGDIALLLRSTSDQDIYLSALREAGVAYVVERDRSYYRRREVIEAAALVRAVLDPSDQLALLTLWRSAWVGVPDAALVPLWNAGVPEQLLTLDGPDEARLADIAQRVRAACAETADVPGLGAIAGWEEALAHAIVQLASLRASFREDPVDTFVERLRQRFQPEAIEAARYLGAYRLANLERFFNDLLRALEAPAADVHAVVRRLRTGVSTRRDAEEGRPPDVLRDALRVMTIHKAKGLAFEHVYIAQAHKPSPPRLGSRRLDGERTQARQLPGGGGWTFQLCGLAAPSWDAYEAHQEAVERAERVRLLYVAMTRPRARVVLMGRWPEGPPDVGEPGDARSLLELVAFRTPSPPVLTDALRAAARAPDGGAWFDGAGARWVFPDMWPVDEVGAERARAASARVDVARMMGDARRIDEARHGALLRMGRPTSQAPSSRAHMDDDHAGPAWQAGPQAPEDVDVRARERAMAIGTVVHAALEHLDLAVTPDVAVAAQREQLAHYAGPLAGEGERAAVVVGAEAAFARFAGGPLHGRLRALREHIVARELPVLLPAGEGDDAVGFLSGAIDMVYRDPDAGGRWVIVDYKTDRVGPDGLAERAATYAPQGAIYVRAVAEAFELDVPPAFELWFLSLGEIIRT